MKTINLIPINSERKLAILNIDEHNMSVQYRNIGNNYDIKLIHDDNFVVQNEQIHILNASGDSKVNFPVQWLNPINGMINILAEIGILKNDNN